ncbi:MAG: holo-ACP synthase [Candidatus Saganbacteria bacterium]|nr:holo-ACP synthase [Candidatus Saganbacteria bacterium]
MIKGIGVDIIEIARVKAAVEKFGDAFLRRIFTAEELAYCRAKKTLKYPELAVRFAAKEAYGKALGTGIAIGRGAGWRDIAVSSLPGGQPALFVKRQRPARTHLSLSHSRDYAVAVVYVEE